MSDKDIHKTPNKKIIPTIQGSKDDINSTTNTLFSFPFIYNNDKKMNDYIFF